VPFVFSSNGHLYAAFGDDTRLVEDQLELATFPTPDDLRKRYEEFKGFSLEAPLAAPLFTPYRGGEAARYYFQDAAIRASLEKLTVSPDAPRILLSLATGTGKTVISAHLLYKLARAGQLRRALFVCDRDELRTQALGQLQALFGADAQMVTTSQPRLNARILVASYQTLNITDIDDEPRFWKENFPRGAFSHVVIDEAHRSAWGKWSVILSDNPEAVQIGLTATPRILRSSANTPAVSDDKAITAHNLQYFGDPVYEYTMGAGMEDGYIARCEVIRRRVDIDRTVITREDIVARTATDPYTGGLVDPALIQSAYSAQQFDGTLMLPDRVQAMSEDLFELLLQSGGPHQKTIIFCARESHASNVQVALNNVYERWCRSTGTTPREWYAFQCTGNPNLRPGARELIADFKGSQSSHYVATTVDLLSTGIDIPNLANVVIFRYLESPISFHQMIGRGSRTGSPRGSKSMFRVYDYTDSSRLFGEPFVSAPAPATPSTGPGAPDTSAPTTTVRVEGFSVAIEGGGRSILVERDGRDVLVPLDQYKQELAQRLTEEAEDLSTLREKWVAPAARRALLHRLPGGEPAVRLIRALEDELDCDLYDVLAELGYGVAPKSRAARVADFPFKNRVWLRELPEETVRVLAAITRVFAAGGIDDLETQAVFDANEVRKAGGIGQLETGSRSPAELLLETKARLLAA
jgi:type I restriction enzyme R subunit